MAKTKKAKEKKPEKKFERIYTIPLRREVKKAPRYKKAEKAIRTIRAFLVKHMKVPDRDINKIKIGRWVNEAIWTRGIRKPPQKITIRAEKDSEGNVKVDLVSLPPKFAVQEAKIKKKAAKITAKEEAKKEETKKKKEKEVKEKETKEKEEKKEEEKKEKEKSEQEKIEEKEKKEKEKALHKEVAKPPSEYTKIKAAGGKKERKEIFRKALEK